MALGILASCGFLPVANLDGTAIVGELSLDGELRGHLSADEALDSAKDAKPGAIVLDMMLPDFDGLEVMRRIRTFGYGTPSLTRALHSLSNAVTLVAESAIPTVQALIRWDPVGHAEFELDSRSEVRLPPAVHIAAVDGAFTSVARFDRVGDQRIPRRAPNPLADAVGDADRQYLGGRLREPDQRADQRGDAIAEDDQGLPAPHPIRQPAAAELQEGRDRLRRPFDRPDRRGARPQGGGEKQRQQRIGHVARHVGQEAHRGESEDIAAEPGTGGGRSGRGHRGILRKTRTAGAKAPAVRRDEMWEKPQTALRGVRVF